MVLLLQLVLLIDPNSSFNLATRALSLLTREFELVTSEFELVTHRLELVTRRFELVTRRSLLVYLSAYYIPFSFSKYFQSSSFALSEKIVFKISQNIFNNFDLKLLFWGSICHQYPLFLWWKRLVDLNCLVKI